MNGVSSFIVVISDFSVAQMNCVSSFIMVISDFSVA